MSGTSDTRNDGSAVLNEFLDGVDVSDIEDGLAQGDALLLVKCRTIFRTIPMVRVCGVRKTCKTIPVSEPDTRHYYRSSTRRGKALGWREEGREGGGREGGVSRGWGVNAQSLSSLWAIKSAGHAAD